MTPADELRKAAAKIREAVAQFGRIPAHYPEKWRREYEKLGAPWMALMHPGVAEPLAALLEAVADKMKLHDAVEGEASKAVHPMTLLGLDAPRADWTAALATARAINGSRS